MSPRAQVLTPDSLLLTDLISPQDLTPRDLMYSLLVTRPGGATTRQVPTIQPSVVTVEADIPRNLPRNLPPGVRLPHTSSLWGIACGLTIPFTNASAVTGCPAPPGSSR